MNGGMRGGGGRGVCMRGRMRGGSAGEVIAGVRESVGNDHLLGAFGMKCAAWGCVGWWDHM